MKHKYITKKSCLFIYFIGSVVKIALSEAATGGVLYENMFLESSQNSQENTYARVFFLINSPAPLTPLLIVLAWKYLNIVYRKLMKFFKVLPTENLKNACKR